MNNSRISCPNCKTPLLNSAEYCQKCGQKRIRPEDQSVWHLILESVGDFFHVDSKFFGTLTYLIFRPGFLAAEYLQGRRAKYFHPFKLFLFISFLYFLTSGLMTHKKNTGEPKEIAVEQKDDKAGSRSLDNSLKLTLDEKYDKVLAMPDDSLKRQVRFFGLNRFVDLNFPRESWVVRFMIKQVVKNRIQGSQTFSENMHKTIPKLIFILIPFMAMLLKLLYIRRKIPYFNHMIFSLHFLAFVFLLFLFNLFLELIAGWIDNVVFFLMLAYLYFAIFLFYGQKILATTGKFLLLFFGIMTMLAIFFIIAASISIMLI